MSPTTAIARRPRRATPRPAAPAARVAVVGCGQWGKNLVRNFSDLGALHAVVDQHPGAREWARAHAPGALVSDAMDEILRDPAISACVIATPAAWHYELARQALEAGKDVLVEKPLALTAEEGQRLVELADRRQRILMVGHLLEYHPAVAKLRELIADGTMGKVCYIYSHRLNLGRIRTEENALWSFAPHDIHVMLRLLGEAPVEVACRGGSYLNHHIADVTMSEMRFAGGVRGHIFVSWLHPYKEHRLVVVGDRQMAVFDDTHPTEKLRLYPHRVDWIERVPVAVKAEAEIVPLEPVEPLRAECQHFLECVATHRPPRTDGRNGVEVLQVLEACQRSLEQGGVPVRLAPDAPASPPPAYHAHPSAVVDEGAVIGAGTQIWHFSHVMAGARLGRDCRVGQNVFVGKHVRIGDRVKIQNNVSVYAGVTLEDEVFCGPSAVFTNVKDPRSAFPKDPSAEFLHTCVGRGATIGANATIVCGHTIGRHAFIGAGAVVTRDVPDYALVLGIPARIAGWMCACGARLPLAVNEGTQEASCPACGSAYRRSGQRVEQAAAVRRSRKAMR